MIPQPSAASVEAVRFHFVRGSDDRPCGAETIRITRPEQVVRLTPLLDRDAARRAAFVYDTPAKARAVKLEQLERLNKLSQASMLPGRPRLVLPLDTLRFSAGTNLDVLGHAAAALAERCELVFYPRGVRNSRRMCDVIYQLAACAPVAIVLGLGIQDFLVDLTYDQPQIDIDEFRLRLAWTLEVVQRDLGIPVFFLVAPPAGETVDEAKKQRLSAVTAAPYAELARRLVEAAGGRAFMVSDHYPTSEWTSRSALAKELAAALVPDLVAFAEGVSGDNVANVRRQEASEIVFDPFRQRAARADLLSSGQVLLTLRGRPAESLYFGLRTVNSTESEADEGNALDYGKVLENLGGRDEFERAQQARIINSLYAHHRPNRQHVLIIGDSIRMRIANATGYGLYAYAQLEDHVNLFHIPHNCGSTVSVLHHLDNWLQCRPDIVHVNAGLHDLVFGLDGTVPDSFQSVDQYADNVRAILTKLCDAGVRQVIWGLNTPVHEERHNNLEAEKGSVRRHMLGRRNADIRAYNAAAEAVARSMSVPVTDLFSPIWEAGLEQTLLEDGVHLNPRGAEMLGGVVADAIDHHL